MELSALHTAVRALARGEEAHVELARMSTSERAAYVALRRRIEKAGGKLDAVMPRGELLIWMSKATTRTTC